MTFSIVDVAVPVPLRQSFAYRVPESLLETVQAGVRVAVPFGPRKLSGFVLGPSTETAATQTRLRDVAGVLDEEPIFTAELLEFLRTAALYYMHPLGEVLKAAAPAVPRESVRELRARGFLDAGEKLSRALVRTQQRRTWAKLRRPIDECDFKPLGEVQQAILSELSPDREADTSELSRLTPRLGPVLKALERRMLIELRTEVGEFDPFFAPAVAADTPPVLSAAQKVAVESLRAVLRARDPETFLLHGVTGSGKTEVYLRIIEEVIANGRGAIVLVPEIALTPQLVTRFRSRLHNLPDSAIAVLHSGLTDGERYAAWRRLRRGEARLVIGARSAVFAPVADLGVIIVDEEHDPSFKQEEGFRYNGRDMAVLRAQRASALCILGSATPALESYYLSEQGRYRRLELPERPTPHPLPSVEIVNLARELKGPSGHRLLSGPLQRALSECLKQRKQAILFLNRRGFAHSVQCTSCLEVAGCPTCSVPLTEHRGARSLRCHYCDFRRPLDGPCHACGQSELRSLGFGTEQIADVLMQTFPSARIARLDRDIAASSAHGGVEGILRKFREGAFDILVGTQMVTKGHDIPGVTLVGVMLADQSLAYPDFRAHERTFQLLAQVAGRAGRGDTPGRVLVQTFQPEHVAIRAACSHDYMSFYRWELGLRREAAYAPFSHLVAVRIDAADEERARAVARELGELARICADSGESVAVLGPAPAPIAKLRGRYRFRLLLKASERKAVRRVAAVLVDRIAAGLGAARASVDVDPVSML